MTGSKPLPDGLASDILLLVAELRALKDGAGLSLADLARRTPYSKSSWERYLNGKTLPPQHAVAALGKLSDAAPARLSALWELANTAWHAREGDGGGRDLPGRDRATQGARGAHDTSEGDSADTATESDGVPEADSRPDAEEPPAGRRFGRGTLIGVAVALAAVAASVAALSGVFGGGSATHARPDDAPGTNTGTRQVDVTCFADSCTGKDPAQAGCGDVWTSALQKFGRVYVELRYSDACKAAWSRISWGVPGDIAQVVRADGRSYQRKVRYDTDTFSAMVAAASPSTARACVLLTSGVRGCTDWGGTHHLNEAPNVPTSLLTPTTPTSPTPNHTTSDHS